MTFYLCVTVLTELMMLAMVLHVQHYTGFGKTQKNWYLCTFLTVMLCAAAEFSVHGGYYDTALVPMLTVYTILQFSLAPMLAILFSGALGIGDQGKSALVFFAVSFLTELLCAPFGWVFCFDEQGYCRGPYFFVYEAFFVFSLLYLTINMVRVGRKFQHRDKRTIWMILVILVAGILPMAFYRLNVTYVAIGFAASLCYIYYNDLVQQDIQKELVSNQEKVSEMQNRIISSLASLIESRDMETGEHVTRTSTFVETLARDAIQDGVYTDELDEEFVSDMHLLAPMHDIGKIIVSDRILRKPGRLTEEEFEEMKQHAAAGGAIIRDVLSGVTDEERMSFASDIATYHHEKWNGTGYPKGLSGEQIPLSARIMAIADVFDALISDRCYKKAMPVEEAVQIIRDGAGSHFDPKLVEVFLRHREDFLGKGAQT